MAQTQAQPRFLPSSSHPFFVPNSPDPSSLRLLAFAVAEAALQPDPNSPSFGHNMGRLAYPEEGKATDVTGWESTAGRNRMAQVAAPVPTIAARRGRPLWSVVEHAKERREREQTRASPPSLDSPLPTSPASYNFVLPPNSPLAASIASTKPAKAAGTPHLPPLNLRKSGPSGVLYTRSAEPSPTYATFGNLDQSRPPPEFVPRLSAEELSNRLNLSSSSRSRPASNERHLNMPTRQIAKVKPPTLAEIQAKLKGHRRTSSAGEVPEPRRQSVRSDSEFSLEIIQTPLKELDTNPVVVAFSGHSRPATPPSPLKDVKESRLAPFLRERTSGRLVASIQSRPSTAPPSAHQVSTTSRTPRFQITPPRSNTSAPTPPVFRSASPSPIRTPFALTALGNARAATPPFARLRLQTQGTGTGTPSSPTESNRSLGRYNTSTPSPTLSVPIITCTPARQDELDSDTESEGDVIVFDGEMDKAERERRGREMKDLLTARRRSG